MPRLSPAQTTADRALVKGLNDGDETALAALYDEYAERLYDYALSMTADEKLAGDIVHDTFIDACRRAPRMRDHLHLSSWLYGAARRRCIRRGREPELYWDRTDDFSDAPFMDRADTPAADTTAPAPESAESEWPPSAELHDLLRASLARLDPADQEAVLLAFRHGLRPARLGAALGLSARRVAIRVRRARDEMEAALKAECLQANLACAADQAVEPRRAESSRAEKTGASGIAVLASRSQPPGRERNSDHSGTSDLTRVSDETRKTPDQPQASGQVYELGQARDAVTAMRRTSAVNRGSSRRGPLSGPLWETFHRRGEVVPDPSGDRELGEHVGGCAACRARCQVRAVALLERAPAPVLPAALRHRVMHTATDPELAGHRADIAARGGTLTPEGLPNQPDVPSPFTRRWLFTGGGMAGALVAAVVAALIMGPGIGSAPSWLPFPAHPQPSITHQKPSQGSGHSPGAPTGPGGAAQGRPGAAPPASPQTETEAPKSPTPTTTTAPTPSTAPTPPGDLVIAPAKVELYGKKTAQIRLAARSGPVTWTAMTSTSQLILSQMQGGMPEDGSLDLTITLRTALIGLPGQGTLTFTDSEGATHQVTVTWGATIL
ncbi:RNA polymerase sigma factor [Actinomadura fibrosa]|uniref:RNA polymerase sigma factor n=1 Tax=Actinomadura fibrosa TaxID=111802 RepID=A0ABW2XEW0_9ACTN|nr:sigma-70 family RNA polymerase sigma factor [Actinomadura fibrosa]